MSLICFNYENPHSHVALSSVMETPLESFFEPMIWCYENALNLFFLSRKSFCIEKRFRCRYQKFVWLFGTEKNFLYRKNLFSIEKFLQYRVMFSVPKKKFEHPLQNVKSLFGSEKNFRYYKNFLVPIKVRKFFGTEKCLFGTEKLFRYQVKFSVAKKFFSTFYKHYFIFR